MHSTRVNRSGNKFLHEFARKGNFEMFLMLFKETKLDQNLKNENGDTLLHSAAFGGNIKILKFLLERTKIDPVDKNQNGDTLFHSAVTSRNIDVVKVLYERTKIDPADKNQDGDTPFDLAASTYLFEIVKYLLERTTVDTSRVYTNGNTILHKSVLETKGNKQRTLLLLGLVKMLLEIPSTDPNQKNEFGDSPLHSAVEVGNRDMAHLLLGRTDVDPNDHNNSGDTPLHCAVKGGYLGIVQLLLGRTDIDPNSENKNGETVLHTAIKKKELKIVEFLLQRTNFKVDANKKNMFSGDTPSHTAVKVENIDMVQLLLEREDVDLNEVNKSGDTPLHCAVTGGYLEIFQLLLERTDIDPNSDNKSGYTPLHCAVRGGRLGMVQMILERSDVDPNKAIKEGETPFDLAADENQFEIIKLLLERIPVNIDPTRLYKDGNTVLHKAVRSGRLEIVQLLLQISNIDQNQRNKDGDTLLHSSVHSGNFEMVKLILGRTQIKPSLLNQYGYTPFNTAVEENRFGIVKLLLDRTTIDPTRLYQDGNTVLHKAARNGKLDIVQLLLEISNIDPNQKNKNGDSLIHSAVHGGNIEIVELVLERTNIDPTYKNRNGNTLLHLAVKGNNPEIVKVLLDRTTVDPTEKDQYDDTLLHLAVNGNNPELVKLLLERTKIDPTEKDQNGKTLLHLAVNRNNPELVKLLLERTKIDPTEKTENDDTLLHLAVDNKNLETVKLLLERTTIDPNAKNKGNHTLYNLFDEPWMYNYDHEFKTEVLKLIQSYLNINRHLHTDTYPVIQQKKTIQESPEEDIVNPELILFAGTSEDFDKLLSNGTYESFENRVFLCGSCACGKSTLASVLIGIPPPSTWVSTDGLVIHFGRNGINLETHQMVPLHEENRSKNVYDKVVIGNPKHDTIKCQNNDIKQEEKSSKVSKGTEEIESKRQTTKKDIDSSSKVTKPSDASLMAYQDPPDTHTITPEKKTPASINFPKISKIEAYAVQDTILKEVKSGRYQVKIAPSDLVDFGGQRSYDMTHQLFVQHGGTFVVMFDGSRNFKEPLKEYPTGDISNESIVKHWVNSILTYCVDDNDVMPMILFAATHRDLLSEDRQKTMKTEFVKKVTEMFGTHEMKKHIVFDPVFFINGTDEDDTEIRILKEFLVDIAENQPTWGLRRPMIWVPLELLITNMKKDNINILLKTHFAEANKMNGNLALSDKQLDDFLLTQHALGKIMYFNQPELNSFIILYPPALVNILRSFITDEIFWPEDETLKNILRKMTDTGKIKKRDLLQLWQQEKVNQYISHDEYKEYVLQVLIHLDVLVLPKRYSDKDDSAVDYFLVPCTVKNKMPMSFLNDESFANRTITLVYRLHTSSIPSSLAFKLIGAVSSIWPIKEENKRPLLYHSSAVLYVDSKTEFRIIVKDTRVVVYLTHMPSKFTISPDIAASIQECLTFTLNVVLRFYLTSIGKSNKSKDVSSLFQIEVGEVCERSPCVLSISKVEQTTSWICGSQNEHLSTYPLLWIFDKTQEECPLDCKGLHKDALTMLPSDKHLVRLADQLGIDDCKRMALHLGLKQKDWENLDHKYVGDALTINAMALYTWRKTKIRGKPSAKSFSDLLAGLKAVNENRHLLCKVFREDTDLSEFPNVGPEEVPSDNVLNALPTQLGNCVLQLGVELGITIDSIEGTKTDYRAMYDQTADILRKWKQSTDEKPTICKLMVVLQRIHLGGFEFLKDTYSC